MPKSFHLLAILLLSSLTLAQSPPPSTPPFTSPANVYSGISGPGKPLTDNGANYFQALDGSWFCAFFGNDEQSPFREKPGLVQITFDPEGLIHIANTQPPFLLQDGANPTWRTSKQ